MLAVVKKPRIEIRAKHIPAPLVRFLKDTYKPENVAVCKNEDSIPFEESDWFKNLDSTSGEMIVTGRRSLSPRNLEFRSRTSAPWKTDAGRYPARWR